MSGRKLLRVREVLDRTGLRRSTLYRLMAEGKFPRPRQLGMRAVAWVESEVEEWIGARPVAGTTDAEVKG